MGDVQLLLGPGDAHIGQAALLLQVLLRIKAHRPGEDVLLHPHQEHIGELQPLGRVDGHHDHLVGVGVVAVDVADEGDLLEIAFQAGVHPAGVAVVLHVVDQLGEVVLTLLGLLAVAGGGLLFEHLAVAGQLDHLFGKQVQRAGVQRFLQSLVDLPELEQRPHRPGQPGVLVGVADDVHHAHALLGGQLGDGVHRGRADLAGRLVDDPPQPHVVPGVRHDGHIRVDVLDLFAVVEALAAHDLVGDARAGEVVFDGGRLGVHPVEDGVVRKASALPQVLADHFGDVGGLLAVVLGLVDVDRRALAVFGPQGLALAGGVVLDDAVGGVQDVGGGAVVLFQPDDLGPGVVPLKVEDVLDGGPAEAVDALVVVAHHADVLFRPGEQADQPELGHAGVLVLVHQKVMVAVLVVVPGLLVLLQQPDGVVDQPVEVESAGLLQPLFVQAVQLGGQLELGLAGGLPGGVRRAGQLVFPAAQLVQGGLDGVELVVHVLLLVQGLHHPLGVVGVVDGKAAGPADLLGVAAQDAHTGRVEGGGEHLVPFLIPQHGAQAGFQLPGGLVGKGDGHDVPAAGGLAAHHPVQPGGHVGAGHDGGAQGPQVLVGGGPGGVIAAVGAAEPDQVGDAVDQHGGLAAARAGQDQQRPAGGKDGLPLHLVQPAELFFNVRIPKGTKFFLQIGCHGLLLFL